MSKQLSSRVGLGLCLGAFAMFGCSHSITAADGSKVTFQPGGKIESTDAKGNTVTVAGSGQQVTMRSKDGTAEYVTDNGTMRAHDAKGNSMEMNTGVSESEMGLPFYPGSTETKESMKAASDKGSTFISIRRTTDDPAKVASFYTDRLGKPTTSLIQDSLTMLNWKSGKRSEIVQVVKDGTAYRVSLTVTNEK